MEKKINVYITLSFMLYFMGLVLERLGSIVFAIIRDGFGKMFNTFFSGYTYITATVSIIAFAVYTIVFLRDSFKSVFDETISPDYKKLSISSGIILISGMVHTKYTISALQFASYGVLIVGLLLKFIMIMKEKGEKLIPILTFIYLVSFSMAIPVCYQTLKLPQQQAIAFYIVEIITSLLLVAAFTCMELLLFKDKEDKILHPIFVILMIVLDAATLALKWKEEINYFVLVAAGIAVVIWVASFIINAFFIRRAPDKKAPKIKVKN